MINLIKNKKDEERSKKKGTCSGKAKKKREYLFFLKNKWPHHPTKMVHPCNPNITSWSGLLHCNSAGIESTLWTNWPQMAPKDKMVHFNDHNHCYSFYDLLIINNELFYNLTNKSILGLIIIYEVKTLGCFFEGGEGIFFSKSFFFSTRFLTTFASMIALFSHLNTCPSLFDFFHI